MDESGSAGRGVGFGDGIILYDGMNYNNNDMEMIHFGEKSKKFVEVGGIKIKMAVKNNHHESPLSKSVDPLIIPEVLEKVLSYLSLSELSLLKQVSKLWRTEARRQILKRGRVNLVKVDKLMTYNQNYRPMSVSKSNEGGADGGANCADFFPHNAFKICIATPYISGAERSQQQLQAYKVHINNFFSYFGELYVKNLRIDVHQPHERELRELLDKHAPYLQVLILKSPPTDKAYIEESHKMNLLQERQNERERAEVEYFNFHPHNIDRFRRRAQNQEKNLVPFNKSNVAEPMDKLNLPYLQELRIESVKGSIQAINLKRFLKFIFASAPNLLKITVRSGGNVLTEDEERILLEAILESDEENELRKLMYMDFPSEFVLREADVIKLKKKLPPSLRRLNLTFHSNVHADSIHNLILHRFYFGLKHLELNFSENMPKPNRVFPLRFASSILANLCSLKLRGYRGQLSFATSLSKLEIIEVNGISEDFRENLFFEPSDLQSCSSASKNMIKVFRSDTQISNRNLESLSNFSSVIQTLELSFLNDEGLRIIFMNLPLIKILKLKKGQFTDSGVTGVSELLCKELIDTETHVSEYTPANFRSALFIGSLPYLSTLLLESDHIGDLTVSFGLASCFKLKNLTLASPKITQMGIGLLERVIVQSVMESIDLSKCPMSLNPHIEHIKKRNYHIEIKEPINPIDHAANSLRMMVRPRPYLVDQRAALMNHPINPHNIVIPEPEPDFDPEDLLMNFNNNLLEDLSESDDDDEAYLHLHQLHNNDNNDENELNFQQILL